MIYYILYIICSDVALFDLLKRVEDKQSGGGVYLEGNIDFTANVIFKNVFFC